MPTLFRFGGYRVVMYSEDHDPAHVHVIGHSAEYVFLLNLPDGPLTLRRRRAGADSEQRKVARILADNLAILREAWEARRDNT